MSIDYLAEAEKFRPSIISTLLIGEAPPPSGKVYFYVPRTMSTTRPVEKEANLPATIFNHYFGNRPRSTQEYIERLSALKAKGISLVDICDEPVKVRGSNEGLCRIIREIPRLRSRLKERGIAIAEESMVFLLARRNYKSLIRCEFPVARCFTWKKFRTEPEAINEA